MHTQHTSYPIMTFANSQASILDKNHRRWTPEEEKVLMRLRCIEHVPFSKISSLHGRTISSLQARVRLIHKRNHQLLNPAIEDFEWTIEIDAAIIFGHLEPKPISAIASSLGLSLVTVQFRQAFLFRDKAAEDDSSYCGRLRNLSFRVWTESEDMLVWALYKDLKTDAEIVKIFNSIFSNRSYTAIKKRKDALVNHPENTFRQHHLGWGWEWMQMRHINNVAVK